LLNEEIALIRILRLTAASAVCAGILFAASGSQAALSAAPQIAPYGAWQSPISAEALGKGRGGIGDLQSVNQRLYWGESMPAAGGKIAVFSMGADGVAAPLTPEGANVRTRVHEYGGAPYVVVGDTIYYSQFSDQRLYALKAGGTPVPVTPEGYRYADCAVATQRGGRGAALICVREDHSDAARIRNAVVRLALPSGGAGEVLFAGSDFVAYPRISRDGTRLAFISWDHPHMPWDGTELKVATLTAHGIDGLTTIAGSAAESVLEPQWDSDGELYFISDRSGFWNLYVWSSGQTRAVSPRAAEFASPLWSFGQANYVLLGGGLAAVVFGEKGFDRLAVLNLNSGNLRVLDLPYVSFSHLAAIDANHIAAIAGSAAAPRALVRIDLEHSRTETLRGAGVALLPPSAVSIAVPIDFPSAHGRVAHAFYYAPFNPAFKGPGNTLPPLVTFVHGGPTAQAEPSYSSTVQFWTSRGFAVVDVNYGGSSGFGRAYRQELNDNWGVVDVEDVIAAAKYLSASGRVDAKRMAISGGSAGGYTVLVALSSSAVFGAGADYYGISDMTALARDTHKFESRYLDSLIGPLPQSQSVYDQRSPLNHLDGFKAPLIVFQGADDPIVPPNQSAKIVEALRARHVPLAYLLYPGEGHGFRNPEHVIDALQSELSFYGRVFGFTPAGRLPALKIENLPAS
jgi:dipeptidyl aminopeptidase/acylaminoacyl peptidase